MTMMMRRRRRMKFITSRRGGAFQWLCGWRFYAGGRNIYDNEIYIVYTSPVLISTLPCALELPGSICMPEVMTVCLS